MRNWEQTHIVYACGCGKGAKAAPGVVIEQVRLLFDGTAPLPRVVTGPVSKKHYLINPGGNPILVDQPDATVFLQLTGEVRFKNA